MKILFKLLSATILLLTLLSGFVYSVNQGYFNGAIGHIIQYALTINGTNTQFIGCKFQNGVFSSSKINIMLNSNLIVIENAQIDFNLTGGIKNPYISVKINPVKIDVWDKDQNNIFQTNLYGNISKALFANEQDYKFDLENINIPSVKDVNGDILQSGTARFQNNNYFLKFNESNYISFAQTEDDPDKFLLEANNIPINIYVNLFKLFPENPLLSFLNEFILDGYIKNVNIFWDTKSQNWEEKLIGKAKLINVDFSYDKELPTLKNIDLDIDIKGLKTIFHFNQAYSSEILLADGDLIMDWKGQDDTNLFIKIKGRGPANSLIDFIAPDKQEEIKKANIDLKQIKGNADIDVNIQIPLKPGTVNIYDVKAEIDDTELDIFKNSVKLSKTKLSGLFDGKKVIISGDGKINNFDSNLYFIYNIEDESKFNHKLDIKTQINTKKSHKNSKTKIGFVTLFGGESVIDLSYINKDSKGILKIDSDISNLDLYFDKLGIRKSKNSKANLLIDGEFNDPTNGDFKFDISGDNITINGDITIKDEIINTNINQLKSQKTDLIANLEMQDDLISINLNGKSLDLSKADMLQFLEKERDSGATNLNLKIDKVRLKNDIWLNDLALKFECDKDRCFAGFINAHIGERLVEMLLDSEKKDSEKWLIQSSNAGALLRGIGAYDSMRSGNITVNIDTSRTKIKSGEIIPILNGTFMIERFVLSNAPAMTKIVSLTSLPGLLNILRGKSDIAFFKMKGDFKFINNILTITNAIAEGPYFNFTINGNIDIKNRLINIKGSVTPNLYGINSIIGSVPLIGKVFSGNKKRGGLISSPYEIKEKY